jgi:diacylglycerol kinase family enzyme
MPPTGSPGLISSSHRVPDDAPLFAVLNVGSGKHDLADVRARLEAKLAQTRRALSLRVVTEAGELSRVAAQAVAEASRAGGIVVGAGGDGTINAVARATLGSGCPFGVLPLGTFNYFSRTHGIPSELEDACDVLLGTRAFEVQVGLLNDRAFLVNASLGLYPKLLEEREQAKHHLGRSRLVAIGAALKTLLGRHRRLSIDLDLGNGKHSLVTPTLFVGNNRLQLARVGLLESEVIEQRRLVAIVLKPVGAFAMLRVLLRAALGQLDQTEEVLSFDFSSMTVRPRRGLRRIKTALDGEVTWLESPLTFRVAPEPLLLLRPPGILEDPG